MSNPQRNDQIIPTLDLTGQRALVTGGAGGIGRCVARRLASAGAHVVLTDIADAAGKELADEIGAEYHHLDVSDPDAWTDMARTLGVIDIAFLNAGVSTRIADDPGATDAPMGEVTERAYRRIMGANVDGVVYGARTVLPAMVARGRGHIVITASMAGLAPIPFDPIYGLTKHAMVGFTKSLGATYGAAGVCTSAICPGFADTNIISPDLMGLLRAVDVPIMSPERVADAVLVALDANEPGSLWALWGDRPITRYVPNAVYDDLEDFV
ncbi:MAG: short-chain dehydrogenase/reductase [Ilumatobacteraceae bacterium]|nr:short-chain dehydrogenase/reductase [Ilumatobacteraceae bacterium]